MHPLHGYLAREHAERMDRRRIFVLYNSRSGLVPFCDRELPPADGTHVGASLFCARRRMLAQPIFAPRHENQGPPCSCGRHGSGWGGASVTVVRLGRVVARLARIDRSLI